MWIYGEILAAIEVQIAVWGVPGAHASMPLSDQLLELSAGTCLGISTGLRDSALIHWDARNKSKDGESEIVGRYAVIATIGATSY